MLMPTHPPTRSARLALAVALLAAAAGRAGACASCGCGDPTITPMGVEKPFKNRVRLALEERFGGHTMGDPAYQDEAWVLRSALTASWSPHPRITVVGTLPLIAEWLIEPRRSRESVVGLGDFELSGRAVVFRDRTFSPRHILSVMAGLKMPTGPFVTDSQGYPIAPDDQPGSGSWDPFAGVAYGWFGDNLAVFSSVGYRFTTDGWNGYHRGQQVGGGVTVQFQPWQYAALSVGGDFVWTAADRLQSGIDAPNTGGAMLALSPALVISPLPDWLIRAAVQIHVADWLNGQQTESTVVMLSTVVDLN